MEHQEKTLWERLKHTYRLVIMNNETFEEVGSYRLSLLNVYILLSTLIVLVGILMWMLITYTPLKQYIPGYGGGGVDQEKVMELARYVDTLETQIIAQRNYTENFYKVLTGNVEIEENSNDEEEEEFPDSVLQITANEAEMALRKEVQMDDIGRLAQDASRTSLTNSKPLAHLHFITPVEGDIFKPFIPGESHLGIDLIAPKNTPVKAVLDGYVIFTEFAIETGNVIAIQHANNTISVYKHNSKLLKEEGSFVKAGEAVAVIGNTGTQTDGPHLHFELWHNGQAVDPAEYVNF